jgi:RHS repeat-associated protein
LLVVFARRALGERSLRLAGRRLALMAFALVASCGTSGGVGPRHSGVPIDRWPADAVLYLGDQQQSVVAEVDASGSVVASTSYLPYGQVRGRAGTPGAYGYVGNELDAESGLGDFHARPFRYEAGIFLGVDPLALFPRKDSLVADAALHPYAYSAGNPVVFSDRTGTKVDPGAEQWWADDAKRIASRTSIGELPDSEVVVIAKDWKTQSEHSFLWSIPQHELAEVLPNVITPVPAYGTIRDTSKAWEWLTEFETTWVLGQWASLLRTPVLATEIVTNWPLNRGFLGTPIKDTLEAGTLIDRYGGEGGSFASPVGTPFEARSLPAYSAVEPLNTYRVIKPLAVDAGPAAPCFGQPGMGLQYDLPMSVGDAVKKGYLERVVK